MNSPCIISVLSDEVIFNGSERLESKESLYFFNPIGSKATVCAFTNAPGVIFTGHESGKVALFNVKSGEELNSNERAHGDTVTDLQLSKDKTYCITSSKDKSARVSIWTDSFLWSGWLWVLINISRYMILRRCKSLKHLRQKRR